MIRRVMCALAALAMVLGGCAEEMEMSPWAGELVRLHVIAEDDTEGAQALKLEVRDAVLTAAQEMLMESRTADEAFLVLEENAGGLEACAREAARQGGFAGEVAARTGIFWFPERDYDGVIVPEGFYRALRIEIGEAEGRNWWCVLYPTLCMPGDGEFHSILLEWFERWFGGDGE